MVDQKTVRNKPSISDYFPSKAKKYFKSKIKNTGFQNRKIKV